VIRRLVLLISSNATLIADKKASLSQAQNASKVVESLMAENSKNEELKKMEQSEKGDELNNSVWDDQKEKELVNLRIQFSESKESSVRYKRDLETVKSQAKSVTAEYDRLLKEFEEMQKKYEKVTQQSSGDKKKN
jgi:B-cell receptor-associated protein 31